MDISENLSAKCYQENNERIDKIFETYVKHIKIFLNKIKNLQYDREHYKNLSEVGRESLLSRKKYYKMRKNVNL